MGQSRRKFLRTGIISVVSAGIALSGTRIAVGQKQARGQVTTTLVRGDLSLEVQRDPVFSFKAETFKPYVGGIFTAPNALGERIELELLTLQIFKPVSPMKYTGRIVNTESFSLTFKASGQLPPFTSIHKINHPALGEFDLFLTKRITDNGDILYDAVINHF